MAPSLCDDQQRLDPHHPHDLGPTGTDQLQQGELPPPGGGGHHQGVDHGDGDVGEGSGLRGMRERAEQLGGTLEAGPAPVRGWRVRARFPIERVPA